MSRIVKTMLGWIFPGKLLFTRIKKGGRKVALTFDDGPHPENTRALLAILRSEEVKATFFILGENAEKYPDLTRQVSESGHEIGNHSFCHGRISELGIEQYWNGVQKTSHLLAQYAKTNVSLFRPPFGELNLPILKGVLRNNLVLVGWTFDSKDSWLKDKDGLIQYMQTRKVKSGDIILFHEDYGTTIEAIGQIIKYLKKRGFTFVTVSELQGK